MSYEYGCDYADAVLREQVKEERENKYFADELRVRLNVIEELLCEEGGALILEEAWGINTDELIEVMSKYQRQL